MTHPALIERITRSLAYMLRHQPEEFDLELDEYGYAEVEDVVRALNERLGEAVDELDLRDAVLGGDRQRYEIEGTKIRALYGHSIEVLPGEPSQPPPELFVGVSSGDADRARRHGLRAGRRRFLHLALTPEDAMESGRRAAHDYVVITVRAGDAWEEGINFYDRRSLFLSDPIPTEFLEVGEVRTDGFGEEMRERGGRRDERGHGPARHADRPARSHAAPRVEAHVHDEEHGGEHEAEHEVVHDDAEVPSFGETAEAPSGGQGEGRGPRRRGRRGGRGREQGGPPPGAPRHDARPPIGREEHRPMHGHAGGSRGPRSDAPRGDAPRGDAPREMRPQEDRPRYDDRPPRRESAPRDDRPRYDDRPPPRRDDAPRRDDGPRRDLAPRGDEAPRYEASPRGDDRPPRREEAPRRDEAPRGGDRPRREMSARGDEAPRHDLASRGDDRPRRDEPPRQDDRPRRDEPARGHGGGHSEHRPPRGHGDEHRRPDRGGDRRPSAPRREDSPRRDEPAAPLARRPEGGSFGGGMGDAPEAPRREPERRPAPPRPAPEPKRERRPESDDGGFGAGI